ncbi:ATP-dependent DNA helicase RecG [uncultured Megasphaera sp.]|uniref:ATP-dependent DNA helicase RecG n=1 Tax=uncultured Megasphaera sp. TaxID=165188 RepID=UPI0025E3FA01|nr:ATP-dependent DNA helicase RecG [uncultured Megasphaera sp.]
MTFSIRELKGIGPRKEALFAKLHLVTVTDLLQYFPRDYEDRSHIWPIGQAPCGSGAPLLICGTVASVQEMRPRRGLSLLKVALSDGTGAAELVWFNQAFKKHQFRVGMTLTAFGKLEWSYGRRQMNSPETEEGRAEGNGFVPVYGLTDGLRQNDVRKAVHEALGMAKDHPEILPGWDGCRQSAFSKLSPLQAYEAIHFPASMAEKEAARQQLAFEELFDMQLGLLLRRHRQGPRQGIKCGPNGRLLKAFYEHLPFTLTRGQTRAFLDIQADMESEVPMQRLIQGDVGSGKTVVAALALAKIVENGYQGALMAPTGILAAQHYEEFCRLFSGLDVRIALLTGRTSVKERQQLLEELAAGEIDILIGTHALIQEDVHFASLGLVVTDEQHRFGVRQRSALEEKGKEPHAIFMTATPIPRTLALSLYGDLDVSSIRELPPGRKIVKTYAVGEALRRRVYVFMDKLMAAGQQCYVVCPLVEASEKVDLQAATELYEELRCKVFKKRRCGLVHGRMAAKEKEAVMEAFQKGEIQLLVATSVIEVGVNVPNATVMFIDGAERFGLAQLHQLRGRVGRGSQQAYCILMAKGGSEETQQRLKWMEKIHDGFTLAEKDLLLRGSGQLFGYLQHGLPDLRAADIIHDVPLLAAAREAARQWWQEYGNPGKAEEAVTRRFGAAFAGLLNN